MTKITINPSPSQFKVVSETLSEQINHFWWCVDYALEKENDKTFEFEREVSKFFTLAACVEDFGVIVPKLSKLASDEIRKRGLDCLPQFMTRGENV